MFFERCIQKAASKILRINRNDESIPFQKIDHLLQKSEENPEKVLHIISSYTIQQVKRKKDTIEENRLMSIKTY